MESLTNEQLAVLAKTGDKKAMNQLYLAVRLLIIDASRSVYFRKSYKQRFMVDLEDMIQVGNLTFLIAVDKWDPNGAAKFSTYLYDAVTKNTYKYMIDNTFIIKFSQYWSSKESFRYRIFSIDYESSPIEIPVFDETDETSTIGLVAILEQFSFHSDLEYTFGVKFARDLLEAGFKHEMSCCRHCNGESRYRTPRVPERVEKKKKKIFDALASIGITEATFRDYLSDT